MPNLKLLFQDDGLTPLHIACEQGDGEILKVFFQFRANANITDNQDRTPIHIAAEKGYSSIVETLADKFKASIFKRTKVKYDVLLKLRFQKCILYIHNLF